MRKYVIKKQTRNEALVEAYVASPMGWRLQWVTWLPIEDIRLLAKREGAILESPLGTFKARGGRWERA